MHFKDTIKYVLNIPKLILVNTKRIISEVTKSHPKGNDSIDFSIG